MSAGMSLAPTDIDVSEEPTVFPVAVKCVSVFLFVMLGALPLNVSLLECFASGFVHSGASPVKGRRKSPPASPVSSAGPVVMGNLHTSGHRIHGFAVYCSFESCMLIDRRQAATKPSVESQVFTGSEGQRCRRRSPPVSGFAAELMQLSYLFAAPR